MVEVWKQFRQHAKSRWSALAASLWRSRNRYKFKVCQLRQQIEELLQERRQLESWRQRETAALWAVIAELNERIRVLEHDLLVCQQQPIVLPDDPPMARHRYGPLMISLALTLAPKIGLRATQAAMLIFFEWLKVDVKVPHWTTIRNWLQRLGVAALQAPVEQADDWIWLADHSVQIGQEKALAVLGTRASQMPEVGTPLRHQDVRLLHLEVSTSCTTQAVSASYLKLAETAGNPRWVVTDGDRQDSLGDPADRAGSSGPAQQTTQGAVHESGTAVEVGRGRSDSRHGDEVFGTGGEPSAR